MLFWGTWVLNWVLSHTLALEFHVFPRLSPSLFGQETSRIVEKSLMLCGVTWHEFTWCSTWMPRKKYYKQEKNNQPTKLPRTAWNEPRQPGLLQKPHKCIHGAEHGRGSGGVVRHCCVKGAQMTSSWSYNVRNGEVFPGHPRSSTANAPVKNQPILISKVRLETWLQLNRYLWYLEMKMLDYSRHTFRPPTN